MARLLTRQPPTASETMRNQSYTRDDGIDRAALAEQNRRLLLAQGLDADEVEAILAAKPTRAYR
jgi:hypothetical protein